MAKRGLRVETWGSLGKGGVLKWAASAISYADIYLGEATPLAANIKPPVIFFKPSAFFFKGDSY